MTKAKTTNVARPTAGSTPKLVPVCSPGSVTWRWSIRWKEGGRKKEKATGCLLEDRAGAEAALAAFLTERAEAAAAAPPGGPQPAHAMKCGQVLTLYAQEHAPQAADPERIGYAIQALGPYWSEILVSEVKGEACRKYLASRTKRRRIPGSAPPAYEDVPVSPATVRRELSTLAAALAHCHREGYLLAAPAVWLPPMSAPREVHLSRSEVARLIRAARRDPRARRHLPIFILIGFYCGRRKESILSLQWRPNQSGGWVDLENGVIDFRPMGRVETAKRRGRLRAPDRLMRILRYVRKRTNTHVLEYGPDRQPVLDVKKSFASAVRNAGMDPARVTPHVLRHTCLTHLAQSGLPLWEACAWVDVTVETGEKVYAHHDDRHDRARDLLDRGGRGRRRDS